MTIEAVFLADICDHPDDDAPRLIYADWLTERGQKGDAERAELIRLQIELAKLATGEKASRKQAAREKELLEKWGTAWARPLRPYISRREFRRGFIESATMKSSVFVKDGATVCGLTPLRHVKLRYPGFYAKSLAKCATLARLSSLSVNSGGMGGERLRTLLSSPHLSGLTALDAGYNKVGLEGMRLLRAAGIALPALSSLALDDNGLRNSGAAELAQWPLLDQLTHLDLAGNKMTDAGAEALAASPYLARLRSLDLSRNHDLTEAGARALLTSPNLPALADVNLGGARINSVAKGRLKHDFPGKVRYEAPHIMRIDVNPGGSRPWWV
jgi:uncharacterized protein (TIGR02996 family)